MTDNRDPAQIEAEIERTQSKMNRTVERLEEELKPRNLIDTMFTKSEEYGVDGRMVIDQAKRNPLALLLIGAGVLWLVSDKDAKPSALKPDGNPFGGSDEDDRDWSTHDRHHRGYVEHMGRFEPRYAEEDDTAFRRRRDLHRANYLMIEQKHDEDDSGFRKRLDAATDSMRERRDQLAEKASQASEATRERARQLAESTRDGARQFADSASEQASRAASQTQDAFYDHPLIGGLAAALVGAVAGAAIPASRTEREQFGSAAKHALDDAEETARRKGQQVADKAREKKDEAKAEAEKTLDEGGSSSAGGKNKGSAGQAGTRTVKTVSPTKTTPPTRGAPIAGSRPKKV